MPVTNQTRCTSQGGPGFRSHHHDAEKAKAGTGNNTKRHWKMKMWKRRTSIRKAKAQAFRLAVTSAVSR